MEKVERVTEHDEFHPDSSSDIADSIANEAFGGHSIQDLPKNYFWNYRFIGSFVVSSLVYSLTRFLD
jgi:hypothetical protein